MISGSLFFKGSGVPRIAALNSKKGSFEMTKDDRQGMQTLITDKEPAKTRVVVAMSGGVDSSVAAAILAEEGYDVIGITLRLHGDTDSSNQRRKSCCGTQDICDAQYVADSLGFPHYVLDYEEHFKNEVIDVFVNSYLKGETPVPCIYCNQKIKFRDLLQRSKELDADCLVTGHYARCLQGQSRRELHRARDMHQDQSYFLFTMTQNELDYVRFPLGDFNTKDDTRILAKRLGLNVANKPDSQDICFVKKGRYTDFIKSECNEASSIGNFVHVDGRVLGQHQGIIHYTVGQRKGLGIQDCRAPGKPLFVVRIDAASNTIIVGSFDSLAVSSVFVRDVNWIGDDCLRTQGANGILMLVKIRSTFTPVPAKVFFLLENMAKINFIDPVAGVSPGQAAVFYDQNNQRVFGGGWIVQDDLAQIEPIT